MLALQVLSDLKFLESLKVFDKDNIPNDVIQKIRSQYVTHPDFDPVKMRNISSACQGLCSWVRAIEVYDKVAKVFCSHSYLIFLRISLLLGRCT